jgi:general secretion pathway protein C
MWNRWLSFTVWAAVAASAVAWGLAVVVKPAAAPRDARVADATLALRGDVSRVLGADAAPAADTDEPPPPAADARFQLVGVLAPRGDKRAVEREGVALIAVDGKPAKAFRVGASVDGQTVLRSVRARGADLGPRDGAPTIALEIPPPPAAATGSLPSAIGGSGGGGAALPPRGVAPPPAPFVPQLGQPVPPPPQGLPQMVAPPPSALPQPVPPPAGGKEALQTR